MLHRLLRAAFTLVFASACCVGQTDSSLRFEVAAVKPATAFGAFSGSIDSGFVAYQGTTLETLIGEAYGLGKGQISGPSWLNAEWHSVSAKFPPGTTKADFRQMMANLLADRFGLAVHRASKDVTGYAIKVAQGGPKLTPSAPDPQAAASSDHANLLMPVPDAQGFPVVPPGGHWEALLRDGLERMTFRQATTGLLANRLRSALSGSNSPSPGEVVPVTDVTGIAGEFDFRLEIPAPSFRLPSRLQLLTGQAMTNDATEAQPGKDENRSHRGRQSQQSSDAQLGAAAPNQNANGSKQIRDSSAVSK